MATSRAARPSRFPKSLVRIMGMAKAAVKRAINRVLSNHNRRFSILMRRDDRLAAS